MSKLSAVLTGLVIVALAGGAFMLATWDIPAPTEKVQKTLSNDQFPN